MKPNLIFAIIYFWYLGASHAFEKQILFPTHRTRWSAAAARPAGRESEPGELGYQSNNFKSGFVSILGNPNVGKSSLLNALLGQKLSAVCFKPQTTRHRIHGILNDEDFQIVFSDTPGIITNPTYRLQEAMMTTTEESSRDADVLVLMTDVFGCNVTSLQESLRLDRVQSGVIVVINKIDLINEAAAAEAAAIAAASGSRKPDHRQEPRRPVRKLVDLDEEWRQIFPQAEIAHVSVMKNIGLAQLTKTIVQMLPKGPRYFPADQIAVQDERFFCSEAIRESILELYQKEIPYGCEVAIETFTDKSPTLSVIEATIMVNHNSHKGIMIGKYGQKMKELGIRARSKLEMLLGRSVYLSLRVKSKPGWKNEVQSLQSFGYMDSK